MASRRSSVVAERRLSVAPEVPTAVAQDAAKATEAEVSMTLLQGLKLYPKAIGWSVLLSTAIVMEGFDIVLINSLYGEPAFQKKFGSPDGNGGYQVSAAWQTGLSNGALVGEILGLMLSGLIAERYGFRKTMIGALTIVIGFIFLLFFAKNLPMLLVGEILCGLPWGVFQTLTCTYAAEVCPVALRHYLTTYINLCWVFGQFISSGVLKAVSGRTDEWAYKIPYGLQWMWPLPLIVGLFLAPESPWWLVRKNRIEDAKKMVLRLTSRGQEGFNADETVAMMVYTNEFEKAQSEGTSYLDCFRGKDLRRTEIVCFTWAVQTLCGASSFMGYSTYFYEQAGLDTSSAFTLTLAQYALGAVGTFASWFLMGKFGRRTLYLTGAIAMTIILLTIGLIGIAPKTNSSAQWAIGSMLLVYTFAYDSTVGPVCYSLVAEMPSTRLRNKTVVLARNLYNITGLIANVLTPNMLNPTAWNWGAKSGIFWAGACLLCVVWIYFRLPEPKGRTYAELDMLFEEKISARKFANTIVNPFEGSTGSTSRDSSPEKKTATVHVEGKSSKDSSDLA